MMDLVHVWYHDRYWSKMLPGTMRYAVHDLQVKVTDLELYVIFPIPDMDFIYVWHDDRYWSKDLRGTISTLVHDIKVKVIMVMVLVFSCLRTDMLKFYVKVFLVSFCEAFDGLNSCLA